MYYSVKVRTLCRPKSTRSMSALNVKPERRMTRAGSFAGVSIPSSTQVRAINKPDFGTISRQRSHQDSSWLGNKEFENSGLASRLARKSHLQSASTPATNNTSNAPKFPPTERSTPSSVLIEHRIHSDPRGNTRLNNPPRPGGITRRPQNRSPNVQLQRDNRTRYGNKSKPTGGLDAVGGEAERGPVLPPTANFETTDLDHLFAEPAPTPIKPTSDRVRGISQRVQLTLEHKGGDYSRLLPKTITGDRYSPVNCAQAVIARRRDVGVNRRIGALNIVKSMVGKWEKPSEL